MNTLVDHDLWDLSCDIAVEAMGCKGYRVQSADDLRTILDDAFRQDVPAAIDCPVDYGENALLTQRLKAIIDGHSA